MRTLQVGTSGAWKPSREIANNKGVWRNAREYVFISSEISDSSSATEDLKDYFVNILIPYSITIYGLVRENVGSRGIDSA